MGNFSMLPSEIILEILSRLPVGSILECKLVSKLWRNFVQHPSLSRLHLGHLDSTDDSAGKSSFITTGRRSNLFYTEYDESLNLLSKTKKINLRPPFKLYYILGSCNGLICFNARDDIYLGCKPAYICNPITREYIMLPEVQGKGHLLTGFGYCNLSNKYKVVSICNYREDPNFRIVQVYTLGSGIGWRNVGKMDYDDMIPDKKSGVFANGAIHWLDTNQRTILAFDLADEELHAFPSPPGLPPYSFDALNVSGNFVCAFFRYVQGWESWNIWILKKNRNLQDEIWSKEFSRIYVRPISFTKSGGLLCYDTSEKSVYRYAPQASSSRVLVDSRILDDSFQFGVPHKNTLVSLKALGEEDTRLMDSGERARSSREAKSSDH